MLSYFLRRALLIIPTFLGITLLVFTITRFVPGGPVERMLLQAQVAQGEGHRSTASKGAQALSDEQIEELKAFYGLDKPMLVAYWEWLQKLVKLDLGESTRYYEPVWDLIKDRLPVTAFFGVATFLLSYLVSIPLGIAKALRHNSRFDSASSMFIYTAYALPAYVVGIFLITVFAFHLEWLPMGGFPGDDYEYLESNWDKVTTVFTHALLPLIAYAIGDFAVLTMTMKNSLMENLSADYVRTAVAKGLPFRKAVTRHAMRNSLIPIASHFGSVLTVFFGGSFLIETIFNIDGIGLLGYEAIVERDYPTVMGILAITSVLMLLGNILSDICVALVDPRVRFGE
ncbi:ABC transporter permease subunit [Aeromonas diversa]|uniref:Oligopeptide transport system permease OppB n=1 Tax=Aeromonas diversa CDC 2478-85 TaxID=1268237 RepID=N9VQ54_9GAMM|nr:ABC transporter permease subunit [Aeromonas diversa]ENY73658.1 oligopeptide transport system permease OppB [Aeromonas diversa CDC 2478-85]